jgi:diguanylate cyclase (GGDEF)-like protein
VTSRFIRIIRRLHGAQLIMKESALLKKIENNGVIIVSVAAAFIYWHIDTLQLGEIPTRLITVFVLIGYGVSTQYLINSSKRMAAEMLALSLTDHLTGLYNRRGFVTLAQQQLKIEQRATENMSLLFSDIDLLKEINDSLGHSEGDEAIVQVASILKETFRESDIIARIGGDEFVVLATRVEAKGTDILEKRLQQHIDSHNAKKNRDYEISISTGIAHIDPDSRLSIDELVSKADAAMYEQKRHRQSQMP